MDTTIQQDRRMEFIDLIEKHGSVGRAKLQTLLGWGDGIFERTKRDVLELYSDFINYNKKNQAFHSNQTRISNRSRGY